MRVLRRASLVFAVLTAAAAARAQQPPGPPPGPPPAPKNLQVLPKDMPREQLIPLMRGIARSLGVKCDHCHAPGPKPDGPPDFPSDAKWEKRTARAMMRMTAAINDDFIAKLEARPSVSSPRSEPEAAARVAISSARSLRPWSNSQSISQPISLPRRTASRPFA